MMVARGGVEHRACGGPGVGDLEGTLLDAVGQGIGATWSTRRSLCAFTTSQASQRQIGLKISGSSQIFVLDREHGAEPLFQPRRRRTVAAPRSPSGGAVEPALVTAWRSDALLGKWR